MKKYILTICKEFLKDKTFSNMEEALANDDYQLAKIIRKSMQSLFKNIIK